MSSRSWAVSWSRSSFPPATDVWGAARTMTALEATMWRAEADPLLRSGGVVAEHLDRVPDRQRLLAGHEWAVTRVPRLRQRVADDPLRLGPPVWVDCEVDLQYHLRTARACDDRELLDVAAALHMAPFDPARPLWEGVLVEGLPAGRAVYLLKLHHSLSDGTGVVQLLDLLHSDRRAASPDKPGPPPLPVLASAPRAHGLRALAGDGTRLALAGARVAGRFARSPRGTVAAATRFARSLTHVAGPSPAPPSPALAGRGLARRLGVVSVPAADLRAAGRAAGGTLNDAFLAALAGGLAAYHRARGVVVDDVPLALPVSLRGAGDEAGGNRFAGARIALPVSEPDLERRIRLIHERVLRARGEPALDFLGLSAPLTSRLPTPVLTRTMRAYTASLDVQASNFRGLDRPAYIAGARVEAMHCFGPAPGCGFMATLVTHEGTCHVGLTIDADAVADPAGLVAAMDAAFIEVAEAAA